MYASLTGLRLKEEMRVVRLDIEFSFYYAHHLTSIEGGMVCTNDKKIYQYARMFRSHGMVRESTDDRLKSDYKKKYGDLNPDFIFSAPAYNMRSNEIHAVMALNQLKKLDKNNKIRAKNLRIFLKIWTEKILH